MNLDTLLLNPNALPTAPKVVEELISSFDNPVVAVEDVARKIALDPVLSAKLLRLANSAYYHVSRSIGSVDDAVRMLGFVTVRTLVISSGLVSGFKTVPGLDLKQFWRYSLHAAVASKWLAKQTQENTDLAFTIAMMHALGQLVMHSGMPEPVQALDQDISPYAHGRSAAELAAFGFDFTQVGAELARRWKFPPVFATTIADLGTLEVDARIAAVVHIAVWCARAEQAQWNRIARAAALPVAALEQLDLAPELLLDELPPLGVLCAGLEELIN